ncbi:MAG: hypothetical protein AAF740_03280 [Bacteroidota bacterium]
MSETTVNILSEIKEGVSSISKSSKEARQEVAELRRELKEEINKIEAKIENNFREISKEVSELQQFKSEIIALNIKQISLDVQRHKELFAEKRVTDQFQTKNTDHIINWKDWLIKLTGGGILGYFLKELFEKGGG